MVANCIGGTPGYQLFDVVRTRDGADAGRQVQGVARRWAAAFPPGRIIPDRWVEPSGLGPDISGHVNTPPISFSWQTSGVTGSGDRPFDACLDQVVSVCQ